MRQLNKKMCGEYIQYPEKVLQFGEGNFLRAFADWQIDQLNQLTDFNGSVVAVQPRGSEKIKRLNEQDGLFTLFLRGIKDGKPAEEHMIVKSISRGIDLFSDYDSFKRLAAQEELRFIISNTTEAGITFEKGDRLEDRPQKTFPGKLAAFLYFRYKAFAGDAEKGCIVLPCELVEENGRKLKAPCFNMPGCGSWSLILLNGFMTRTSSAILSWIGLFPDFLLIPRKNLPIFSDTKTVCLWSVSIIICG